MNRCSLCPGVNTCIPPDLEGLTVFCKWGHLRTVHNTVFRGKNRRVACLDCHKRSVKLYRPKGKQKALVIVIEAKSKPCMDCRQSYPHYVMDFDHRGDKKFSIGKRGSKISLRALLLEIAKCDVVCSNCHRERTYRRLHAG